MNQNGMSDQPNAQQAMFPADGSQDTSESMQEGSEGSFEQGSEAFNKKSRTESRDESHQESFAETRKSGRNEILTPEVPVTPEPEIIVQTPTVTEVATKPTKVGRRRKAAAAPSPSPAKAKGKGKKAAVSAASESDEAIAPAPKAARRSTRKTNVETVETPVPEVIVKTGSTDRHQLILEESDDEPLIPSPGRRPRTYRDLDEIPDDLD